MGFADYLSRHQSGTPPPINEDDEKFVINTTEEIKHAILKQNIIHVAQINQLVITTNRRTQFKMNEMTSHMLKKTHTLKKVLFAILQLEISRLFHIIYEHKINQN